MKPMIIPVIHYLDDAQALRNARRVVDAGCPGVMLIDMACHNGGLIPIAKKIKALYPNLKVGINLLGQEPSYALTLSMENGLNMTWTDEQVTHSNGAPWEKAHSLRSMLQKTSSHLMFIAVAFKHQIEEPNPAMAAKMAFALGLVATTSGPATGIAPDAEKIRDLRLAIGPDAPLAIASGITPENFADFAPYLTHVLVSTGISDSFYEMNVDKLRQLVALTGAS